MNEGLKKQTLWIFLFPALMLAQEAPVFQFDFGKKKKDAETNEQQNQPPAHSNDDEETDEPKKKKEKIKRVADVPANPYQTKPEPEEEKPDFKKGIFKGLFIAGLNATQVDGDDAFGYNYLGAHVGVGALAKFHKHMSVSMEILYSMKGAQRRIFNNTNAANTFRIVHDYMEVPLLFNVHDKKFVLASAGLGFGYMVRNGLMLDGVDYTNDLNNAPITEFTQEPNRFELSALAGVHFVIKEQFALGVRFSYSLIGIRDALPGTRVRKQYNNVLSFRFMYILKPKGKK